VFTIPRCIILFFLLIEAYHIGVAAWRELLGTLVVGIFMEPFSFATAHIHIHVTMLEAYQRRKIEKPMAFHHHYNDTTLYMKLPYGHAMSYTSANMLLGVIAYLYNFNPVAFLIISFTLYFDMWTHRWYHTSRHYYNSWNYLSANFKPMLWAHLFAEKTTLSKKPDHAIHHSCEAEDQHTHESWVDLYVPGSHHLALWYCNTIWYLWRKYLIFMRGTDVAVPFEEGSVALKQANSLRDKIPTFILSRIMVPISIFMLFTLERVLLPAAHESAFAAPVWYRDWRLGVPVTAIAKYVIVAVYTGRFNPTI
jgi:hypothetical protein